MALVNPLDVAVSVYTPAVLKLRLEKVATPFTAATVVVPLKLELEEATVTEAVDPVTTLPEASSIATFTSPRLEPAVTELGCPVVVNASFVAVWEELLLLLLPQPDKIAATAKAAVKPVKFIQRISNLTSDVQIDCRLHSLSPRHSVTAAIKSNSVQSNRLQS